ncbi:Rv0340 family IniB-related protein [Mycobacterium sp. AMU20-3851]|uniref:Rv0340 family IniB-related protein n=1 Tax=Mycobacterium sp. AMU20-3851 TaxID=3122055 RepID=UPI003754DEBB
MANSLLDFVMGLVRDPDAAARYAADPAAVLAAADLPDVTTADVDQLIPVVADSVSGPASAAGLPAADDNVWASGAATAAFDAFGIDDAFPDGVPVVAHDLDEFSVREVVHTVAEPVATALPTDELPVIEVPVLDDFPVPESIPGAGTLDAAPDQDWTAPDPSGFDLFD